MKTFCKYSLSGGGNFNPSSPLIKGLLSLLFITSTLTACNDADEAIPSQASNKLNITVGLNTPQSRAGIITGNTLAEGSTIGILLDDGAETDYDAVNNIKFTASTQDAKQVWTPASDIVLSDTKGTLYAYYPYAQGTDLSAIPVETATQTDFLYATPVQNVNESNASVAVTMNHMLSNIKVSIARGTYVGTGNISNITIQSDGLATGGTFNAAQATPAFSSVTGTGDEISRNVTATLGGTATDIMVVPTGTSKVVTFTATIDDVDYTVTSSDVELEEGNSYEYTLSLNSTFMSIASVAVNPWTSVPKESLTLEKDISNVSKVYAVREVDKKLIEYENIDTDNEQYIAVALHVTGKNFDKKFWIEKNEASNTSYATANDSYESSYDYDYYFSWGGYGTDQADIPTYNQVGGNSSSWTWGYLPKADGSYLSTSNNLSSDITTWTDGTALGDFNGKENSESIKNVLNNGSGSNYYTPMGVLLNTFNESSNTENFGYTDWYIPACGQLALMWLNMAEINTALTAIGGTTISSGSYWSSSEYSSSGGWRVYFYSGGVGSYSKDDYNRVRFVRDF